MSIDNETLKQSEGEARRVQDKPQHVAEPASAAPSSSVTASRSRPRFLSLRLLVCLGVAALATLAFGIWCRLRPPPAELPAVDLAQIDQEIVESITEARAEV